MPKVLDLFSGAGGFSLGFELAGCEIIGAIEHDKWAADTFQHNHIGTKMLLGDIESFDNDYIKNEIPTPDMIIGGPPCQGFSICLKNAGDPKDPRNSLFTEYVRIAKLYKPTVLILENVPNIIKAKTRSGEKVIEIIQREFEQIGYYVYSAVLNASDYGVPQMRQRFVMIASKQALENPFPKATHYVSDSDLTESDENVFSVENGLVRCPTLWEAISDLPNIEARQGAEEMDYTSEPKNSYQKYCRNGSTVLHNHLAMKHTQRLVERFSQMTWGQSISDITWGQRNEHICSR